MNSQKPAFREAELAVTRQINHASAHSFIVLSGGVSYRGSELADGIIAMRDVQYTPDSFAALLSKMDNPRVVAASSEPFKAKVVSFISMVKDNPHQRFKSLSDSSVFTVAQQTHSSADPSVSQHRTQRLR